MSLSMYTYRKLMLLYPQKFRHEYGDLMLQIFQDCCRDARNEQGIGGMFQLWTRTSLDLMMTVPKEHLSVFNNRKLLRMNTTAFDKQLASSINLWVKALRSGYSVWQSFEILAKHAPEPTASEFRKVVADIKNGVALDEAMGRLMARMPSKHFGKIMDITQRQRQEGGNLADKLDTANEAIIANVGVDGWSDDVKLEGE